MSQTAADTNERRDPFAPFSLDTLVSGAARLRPDSIAFADRDEVLTYAAVAARSAALARMLAELGLKPGDRVVMTGGASAAFVAALAAGVRAGLELALAPLDLPAPDLLAYAASIGAVALIGPTRYGDLNVSELLFAVAAELPAIRLVGTFGPGEADGAVDLSAAAIARAATAQAETDSLERGKPAVAPSGRLTTLMRGEDGVVRPVAHRQATLMAAGLDLVARARIGRRTPVLTTFAPVTFAALVSGPIAALLAGAELHLEGPFEVEAFLAARERIGQGHLVVPSKIAPDLAEAGVTQGLASLVPLARAVQADGFEPFPEIDGGCAVIDLYAVGEIAAVAEPRHNGRALGLAREAHHINFDGTRILAVDLRRAPDGALALGGAAVSGG